MLVWFRFLGVAVAAAAILAVLEYFGVVTLGESSPERAQAAAHHARELFWRLIFVVVMATAVWAAARRVAERWLRRA